MWIKRQADDRYICKLTSGVQVTSDKSCPRQTLRLRLQPTKFRHISQFWIEGWLNLSKKERKEMMCSVFCWRLTCFAVSTRTSCQRHSILSNSTTLSSCAHLTIRLLSFDTIAESNSTSEQASVHRHLWSFGISVLAVKFEVSTSELLLSSWNTSSSTTRFGIRKWV